MLQAWPLLDSPRQTEMVAPWLSWAKGMHWVRPSVVLLLQVVADVHSWKQYDWLWLVMVMQR